MHHPGVEGHANHCIAFDQGLYLVVTKLALMWDDRPTVVVARPDRAVEQLQCFPKSIVSQVRCIEYNAQINHLPQQITAEISEPAFGSGTG